MQVTCPLCANSGHSALRKNSLFDYLVGSVEQRGRDGEPGRLGGLKVEGRNLALQSWFFTQLCKKTYELRMQESDADRLRLRAERMRELANRAYCEENYDFARLLTQLATEVLDHAREMEEANEKQ
jgi:hypothetical protein